DAEGCVVHAVTGAQVTVGRSESMSKSKRNVVDPETIIDAYGADTARLIMMSDTPPDRDLEWTEAGVEGAFRFVNRLWRLIAEPEARMAAKDAPPPAGFDPTAADDAAARALREMHKTIARVTEDLEKFGFNRAVARIREFTNTLAALEGDDDAAAYVRRQGAETLSRLIGPMMPHLAEELWHSLGHAGLLARAPWPEADRRLTIDERITVGVQVNGKLRGTIDLVKDADQEEARAAALTLPGVARAMAGKEPRKVIVIPNRIVNVVV
ncbi:MAG: class I tRNA ligase family protein, partial [Rhodoplanes sp.]